MQTEGYPLYFFLSIAALGLIFFIWRPQYNFWFSLFYFSVRELRTASFTRIEGFGPYLNLDDFVLIILVISLIHISYKRGIKIPNLVIWLSICFIVSLLTIGINYSFIYEVQREHKFALYFILGIFFGYNFVLKEKDFEIFLKILFIGSFIASIQYLLFAQEKIELYGTRNIETIRSVGFMALIPIFIITSIFIKIKWLSTIKIKLIYFSGLSMMVVNIILSQTRSIYISIILTVFLIYLFHKEFKVKSGLIFLIIVPFIVYIIFDQYFKFININELIFGRMQLLSDSPSTDVTTIGRAYAIKYEIAAFLKSNIIFGNGLGFTYFIPEGRSEYISWGHIGHIAYLARLGLLGFIIYSIYIPFTTLKYLVKTETNKLKYGYTKIFIIFATALIINDWISFWMSASYLGIGAFLSGTVIGTVWALKDKKIKLAEFSVEIAKNDLP